MNVNVRVSSLVVFLLLCSAGGAAAQMSGPDEAIGSKGGITQKLALSQAQRSAIYNAAVRQKVPTSSRGITAVVGTPVLPSVPLFDLPSAANIEAAEIKFLKYAMVEDNVVVVDPIRMRVIDVIHGGATP
ncbi:MAG: hypothetical protein WB760_25880 [Xanthobacteraceae bacterium]